MLRLIIEPDSKPGRHMGRLESTGEVVVRSHQPLVDGARELIARGFDPATPLTMRHAGKSYDSFAPKPIGHWAKWTYNENDRGGLRRRRWVPLEMPIAAVRWGQKSGVSDLPATTLPERSET